MHSLNHYTGLGAFGEVSATLQFVLVVVVLTKSNRYPSAARLMLLACIEAATSSAS